MYSAGPLLALNKEVKLSVELTKSQLSGAKFSFKSSKVAEKVQDFKVLTAYSLPEADAVNQPESKSILKHRKLDNVPVYQLQSSAQLEKSLAPEVKLKQQSPT